MKLSIYILYLIFIFGCDKDGSFLEVYNEPYFGFPSSLVKTTDGGFIVAGWGNKSAKSTTENGIVFKLNSKGKKEWLKEYGDSNIVERFKFVVDAGNDEYFLGGVKNEDIWLNKINANGSVLLEKKYGENFSESGEDACYVFNDKSLFIVGNSNGSGNGDIIILKVDNDGNVLRENTFGDFRYEKVFACIYDPADSSLIVSGTKRTSNKNGLDGLIMKIDTHGKLIWERTFGDQGGEILWDLEIDYEGNYILAGTSSSYGIGTSIMIMKIDKVGEKYRTEYFKKLEYTSAKHINKNYDNTFRVVGRSGNQRGHEENKLLILSLDKHGDIHTYRTEERSFGLEGKTVVEMKDGESLISGVTSQQNIYISKILF